LENQDIAALRQQVAALTAQITELTALKARYDALINTLRENGKQHAAARDGKERLRCSRLSERAILHFLREDPAVLADRRITAPLADLSMATLDASKGVNADLLNHSRGPTPSRTSRETVQGVLLGAVYWLKKSGMGTAQAIERTLREARRVGLHTEKGGDVQTGQLTNWWKDVSSRATPKLPAEAVNVFNNLRAMIDGQPAAAHQRQQAEHLVSLLLQSLVHVAPRSAPDPNNRAGD